MENVANSQAETINDRLKKFYTDEGLTQEDFAAKIGASQQYISAVVNNKRNLGPNMIKRIRETFPDLDMYWLLNGGEKTRRAGDQLSEDPVEVRVEEPYQLDYLQNKNKNLHAKLPDGRFMMKVPLVPIKAYARYINDSANQAVEIDDYTEVYFDVNQFGKGNYMAFEVKGDSMDNGGINDTPDKATVLGRELQRHHWKDGFRDSIYGWIIVHPDTILCKDIIDQDLVKGTIVCHSRNASPEYADFTINLDEVVQIFKIIKRTF